MTTSFHNTDLPAFGTSAETPIRVTVLREPAQLEKLRAWWQSECQNPNCDLDHFLLVCRLQPNVLSPIVIHVETSDNRRAILVGRLESTTVRARLGYWSLPGIRARSLTLLHGGAIGDWSGEMVAAAVNEIRHNLDQGLADLTVFNLYREDSPIWPALVQSGCRTSGLDNPSWAVHWEMSLKPHPGFLLEEMKGKHRGWIRRKARELEASYPNSIRWKWHTTFADLEGVCSAMESVAKHTYQRGLGAGFRDDEFHRSRLALFARKGTLRVLILELNQQPAAFWVGTMQGKTFHSDATGYLPQLSQYEIGTQIFLRIVDELAAEGSTRFDFGLGDAHYKQRFGDRSWRELTVRLFASGGSGRLLQMYLNSTSAVDRVARRLLQKVGHLEAIKQTWRKRLAARR